MKKFLSIFALILTVFGLNNQAQAEEKNMANTKKLVVYFSKT